MVASRKDFCEWYRQFVKIPECADKRLKRKEGRGGAFAENAIEEVFQVYRSVVNENCIRTGD